MGPARRGDARRRSCPCRAGLGSAIMRVNPGLRPSRRRTATTRTSSRCRRCGSTSRCCTPTVPTRAATRQYLGPDWYFDDLFAMAADRTFVSCERIVAPEELPRGGSARVASGSAASSPTASWRRRYGAHFTHCVPDYQRDEQIQKEYAATRRRIPTRGPTFRAKYIDIPEADYRTHGAGVAERERGSRHERAARSPTICVVACAEAWRGDGEMLASPIGTIPTIGARLAALTFEPDLVTPTATPCQLGAPLPIGAPAPTCRRGRRGVAAVREDVRHRLVGTPPRDDGRDPGRPVRQPEHRVHRPVGEAEGAAPRRARRARATPSTTPRATGSRCTGRGSFVEAVDCVSGSGTTVRGGGSDRVRSSTRSAA